MATNNRVDYDKNTDYMKLMKQAEEAGDLEAAAQYEKQRNQKIEDMNATATNAKGYQTTNWYQDAEDNNTTQYSDAISNVLSGIQNTSAYQSAYTDKINSLLDNLQNSSFSYDFDTDPQKAAYEKNAQTNFDNTLAQLSARTGGLASSYAGQASQQAYQDTMDSAYNTLRSQALNEYENNLSNQYSLLSTLSNLDSSDYSKYADNLTNQYNLLSALTGLDDTEYTRNYQASRDAISDARYDTEQAKSDATSKAQLLAESGDFSGYGSLYNLTDAQVQALTSAYKRDDEETLAQLMASYGMYDDYVSLLGGTSDQASKLNAAYQAANTATTSSSSGSSSGSSSSSSKSSTGTTGDTETDGIYQMLYKSGCKTEGDAYAALIQAGYSATESKNLAGYYPTYYSDYTASLEPGASLTGSAASAREIIKTKITNGTWDEDQVAQYIHDLNNTSYFGASATIGSNERAALEDYAQYLFDQKEG